MIHAIVELGILDQVKFEEIEVEWKSTLVFVLDIPGNVKKLASKHKLKWGRRALSPGMIAGIGATSVVVAAVVCAGAYHFLSDKQTNSIHQILKESIDMYDVEYEQPESVDQTNQYFVKTKDYFDTLNQKSKSLLSTISQDSKT